MVAVPIFPSGKKGSEVLKAIENYLGHGYKKIPVGTGKSDIILMSADGKRKVRFDVTDPSPHKSPHVDIEELMYNPKTGKWEWKKVKAYPGDVPHE